MGILKIFSEKSVPNNPTAQVGNGSKIVQQPNIQTLNPDARKDLETYSQWGARMCGKVAASVVALQPYLQTVYFDIKKAQADNEVLQDQLKQSIKIKLTDNQGNQGLLNNKIQAAEQKIQDKTREIETHTSDKQKILEGKENINKEAKMKMLVGLIILFPLTIYLFVFYSSAFYSAFFKDFLSVTGLANAMFDANAIPLAVKDGFMEAVFIIFAPIIFMGLGFVLHFFSKGTGWIKFVKMSAILLITLTFDIIIAYQIGKHIYDNWVLSQLMDMPPFNMAMAIKDPNFWAVIFCGFIAYIIWGLVFNLVMDAYNDLDLRKSRTMHLDNLIVECRRIIDAETQQKQQFLADLTKLKVDEQRLQGELGSAVIYNQTAIQHEMANFFTGWLNTMSAIGCSQAVQNSASDLYKETLKSFNLN